MEAGFFIIVVAAAFYFILLRPILQQQRRQRKDFANISIGDEVLTQAGFVARVKEFQIKEDASTIIVLDLGNGVEVRALPSAITERLSPAASEAKSDGQTNLNPPVKEAAGDKGD